MASCGKKIVQSIKFVIQKITCGKYSSNLFFRKKQEHSTLYSSIITVIGVTLIAILSVLVIKEVIDQRQVTVQFSKLDETIDISPYEFFGLVEPMV